MPEVTARSITIGSREGKIPRQNNGGKLPNKNPNPRCGSSPPPRLSSVSVALSLPSSTMSHVETVGLLDEIEALVSDKLQVVSYKWLSRNFLVSSNSAKRLLQEFVEKHGSGLEVAYTLAGWLRTDPPIYHIKLVSGPKLSEVKEEFDGNCSVQVYSVQPCIPKDPAALWNAEFVQAEELFRQPLAVDNCLRDNRFCGISNSFVKRNADGTPVTIVAPHPKTAGVSGLSKSDSVLQTASVPQPQRRKIQQSSTEGVRQSTNLVTNIKSESNSAGVHDQVSKPPADKEKVPPLPANKKKGQNDKSSSGTGGLLTNLWGRASAKTKPSCAPAETNKSVPNATVSAEAQICAQEAVEGGSSDDDEDANFKRASNGESGRKRRVVFDFSDEENDYEDAVNLASPDLPKVQSRFDLKQSTKSVVPGKNILNCGGKIEDKPKVKEDKATNRKSDQSLAEDSLVISKSNSSEPSSSEKTQSHISTDDVNKNDKVIDAAPNSPKRRKVLKTRIDERGREVTEVAWEGEETQPKNDTSSTEKKANNSSDANNINRPPVAKSPAVGSAAPSNPVGRPGTKKAGNSKDPKQGNIMSFFKKV
ncbi:uncharacterized protein LOC131151135 [Malania oleifera]|uniref:uncharacterized protein LOC131151135 n=1 Tax=Malania oleifera TaxID=397392 RepID=UPI0025AE5298|nr:uncharacterized protein LOC131151135 [Malania oleifera]